MEISDENKNLIKALINVQSALEPVKKDRKNEFANDSKYATLDAILGELLPKLADNKILMTQVPITEQTDNGVKIGVETILYHESGEYAKFEPFFMVLEKGAKMNMAQSAGSVITYAKRYAISAIFGISTDEDNDGNSGQPQQGNNNQYNKQNQQYQKPNNQQQQQTNQQQNQQQEPDAEAAIVEYVNKFKSMGVDVQQIYAYIAKKEGVESVTDVDKVRIFGYMKAQYLKLQKNQQQQNQQQQQQQQHQQPEQEQGSLLEGRTTKPSTEFAWGSK